MYKSKSAYLKVSDADFQTVMNGCGFDGTPRETITVGDMVSHFLKETGNHVHGRVVTSGN